MKLFANNKDIQVMLDKLTGDSSLMEFNSLKFENLFLPEQFHYIRQVLADVKEEELLAAFIE